MARYRIIVADDYPSTAQVTCTLLGMLGHECRAVDCGARALEEAQAFRPDVAILDIGLPDISGYDVAQQLRGMFGDRLFLAAMTGWGQPQDRARAFASGFDHHVLKPADLAKLKEILRRVDLTLVTARDPSPA